MPRRGRTHAQVIVRAAVHAAMSGPKGRADVEHAARYLDRVAVKRAVVLVLSDFLDLAFERPLHRLNRKHDVIAIPIIDPREERFPSGALARLVDLESNHPRFVDLGRAEVGRRAAMRREVLERRFRASAIDHLAVSTAVPYDRELLRFFKDRAAQQRRPQ